MIIFLLKSKSQKLFLQAWERLLQVKSFIDFFGMKIINSWAGMAGKISQPVGACQLVLVNLYKLNALNKTHLNVILHSVWLMGGP